MLPLLPAAGGAAPQRVGGHLAAAARDAGARAGERLQTSAHTKDLAKTGQGGSPKGSRRNSPVRSPQRDPASPGATDNSPSGRRRRLHSADKWLSEHEQSTVQQGGKNRGQPWVESEEERKERRRKAHHGLTKEEKITEEYDRRQFEEGFNKLRNIQSNIHRQNLLSAERERTDIRNQREELKAMLVARETEAEEVREGDLGRYAKQCFVPHSAPNRLSLATTGWRKRTFRLQRPIYYTKLVEVVGLGRGKSKQTV